MNLQLLSKNGAFQDGKWRCNKGRCKQTALYLHVDVKETKTTRVFTFHGRCEKHKLDQDVTLAKMREIIG